MPLIEHLPCARHCKKLDIVLVSQFIGQESEDTRCISTVDNKVLIN